MSHKVKPGQACVIRTIEVAFPAGTSEGDIDDELSVMLTDHGTHSPKSNVADWRYIHNDRKVEARATFEPVEGEIFTVARTNLPKQGVKMTLGQKVKERTKDQVSVLIVNSETGWDYYGHEPSGLSLTVCVVDFTAMGKMDIWDINDLILSLTRLAPSVLRDSALIRLRKEYRAAVARAAANAQVPDDNI
jgi:hypothetical protein